MREQTNVRQADRRGESPEHRREHRRGLHGYRPHFFLLPFSFLLLCGCADTKSPEGPGPTSRPMTAQERQDAALRDPFGYGPGISGGSSGGEWPTVTGKSGEYDKKGMRRDIDRVFNP